MKKNANDILRRAALCACLLGAGAAAEPISAQQVQVLSNSTPLRLDPTDSSPVITALEAGTVLEWIGESGGYYAVSVPGPPGQENLVGYVLASEVELMGGLDPTSGLPSAAGGMPVPGVAQQYQMAREARSSGVSNAVRGGAVAVAAQVSVSLFFEVEDRDSYESEAAYQDAVDRKSTAESVAQYALIGGAALAAYGIGRYVFGWRKMAELEEEFPEATTPSLERQYAEATLNRSLGRRKLVWGVILGAASYGTVEFVPHFAVPAAEDYGSDAEYQSALGRRDTAVTVRNWVMGVGGVLGTWGLAQWVLASQKMGEIEQVSGMTALTLPLGSSPAESLRTGSPAKLFVGHADSRTQFGVAWSW